MCRWNNFLIDVDTPKTTITSEASKIKAAFFQTIIHMQNVCFQILYILQLDNKERNLYFNKMTFQEYVEKSQPIVLKLMVRRSKKTRFFQDYSWKICSHYASFENAMTVIKNRYGEMIWSCLLRKIDDWNTKNMWFQQDGNTFQTAREIVDLLKEEFVNPIIPRRKKISDFL